MISPRQNSIPKTVPQTYTCDWKVLNNLSLYRPMSLRRCTAHAMHDKNTGSASIIQVNMHQAIDAGMKRVIVQRMVHQYNINWDKGNESGWRTGHMSHHPS